MKIKDGFILKKVMGSYMIVSTLDDSDYSSMQTLNETGAFLWKLLSDGSTVDALCEKLLAEYDVAYDKARLDIENFIATLRNSNLIED